MTFTCTRSFSTKVGNRRRSWVAGDRISNTVYTQLSSVGKGCFMASRQYAAQLKTDYTPAEVAELCDLYVELNGEERAVAAAFMGNHDGTTHTLDSLNAVARQLAVLDNTRPNDTQWSVKKHVAEVASEMYPNLFA